MLLGLLCGLPVLVREALQDSTDGEFIERVGTILNWCLAIGAVSLCIVGVLWWSENRRLSRTLYLVKGEVDLTSLPYVDSTSTSTALGRAMKRWTIGLATAVMAIWLLSLVVTEESGITGIGLAMIVIAVLGGCTWLAFYMAGGRDKSPLRFVERFAQQNDMKFSVDTVPPLWLHDDSGQIRVNWMLDGMYRGRALSISMLTNMQTMDSVCALWLDGLEVIAHTDTLDKALHTSDIYVGIRLPHGLVLMTEATDGIYSRASFSRLYAGLDTAIDLRRE